MAQIFLSYSRKDVDDAKAIAGALSEHGHNVWWDKQISGGSKFVAEIEQALADAEIVIVLWSSNAISSAWVLDEAAEGRDTDRLLPVALDACKPPLGFRQFQTIAAADRLEAALDEIVDAIVRKCGGGRGALVSGPDAASRFAAARRLAEQGLFDDAWRQIETVLNVDPDCADANREAAWVLYVEGQAADAIRYYEKAAGSSRSDHESPAMLISCYRSMQDDVAVKRAAALAVTRSEQAIAAAIDTGVAFASGAKGLAALGYDERARKWVRKALNVDPGNLRMRYGLATTLARFLEDFEAAIQVLEPFVEAASKPIHLQLLERDPDWAEIRDTCAFQALLGRARKRVEAFESTS